MTRPNPTASLLAALSLLTSAATATAEGAWVLWERWFIEETGERNGRALKVNDQTFVFYTCLPIPWTHVG